MERKRRRGRERNGKRDRDREQRDTDRKTETDRQRGDRRKQEAVIVCNHLMSFNSWLLALCLAIDNACNWLLMNQTRYKNLRVVTHLLTSLPFLRFFFLLILILSGATVFLALRSFFPLGWSPSSLSAKSRLWLSSPMSATWHRKTQLRHHYFLSSLIVSQKRKTNWSLQPDWKIKPWHLQRITEDI